MRKSLLTVSGALLLPFVLSGCVALVPAVAAVGWVAAKPDSAKNIPRATTEQERRTGIIASSKGSSLNKDDIDSAVDAEKRPGESSMETIRRKWNGLWQ